jgi:choline dehydrogenase-like flavoprotein
MTEYDFIIVGGGTDGCVLVNRLSADTHMSVLLLEDGPSDWNLIIHIPAAVGRAITSPSVSWRYEVEPDLSRGGKADVFPCGRTLGGSSSINGLFFSRGHVALRSSDPLALPQITLALIDERDLPTIVAGCRIARRILAAPAFKPYVIGERLPGTQTQSDAEIATFIWNGAFADNPLAGTGKMGQDAMAVVTPDLKVRGIEG